MKKITNKDLRKIREKALEQFLNTAPNKKDPENFLAKCYLNSVVDFLSRNGYNINIVYDNN